MAFWQGFLLITTVHLLAAASPGSDFVLVSQHTLKYGRKAGLWCSLGIALGLSVHIIYSVLGLATVVANSTTLLWWIKLLGGCYLIYLGFTGLRSKSRPVTMQANRNHSVNLSVKKSLSMGFACNVLNPKAPIYFIAVFTVVLSPDLPWYQLAIYGVWMMILQWCWFAFVTALLSLPILNQRFQVIGHWIDRAFGAAMIVLGIKVLRS
ncbi:MAG: MFS transporter [Gammaproteobacteria bacterium]|nr:MAG: MFS transporter [Gammaproteobacteria bacterium]